MVSIVVSFHRRAFYKWLLSPPRRIRSVETVCPCLDFQHKHDLPFSSCIVRGLLLVRLRSLKPSRVLITGVLLRLWMVFVVLAVWLPPLLLVLLVLMMMMLLVLCPPRPMNSPPEHIFSF